MILRQYCHIAHVASHTEVEVTKTGFTEAGLRFLGLCREKSLRGWAERNLSSIIQAQQRDLSHVSVGRTVGMRESQGGEFQTFFKSNFEERSWTSMILTRRSLAKGGGLIYLQSCPNRFPQLFEMCEIE